MSTPHRVLILGGGFAGLYTALELEKTLALRDDVDITLVNRENFFLFTPMLHEIAASDLDITNIVNPVRKLLRRVRFMEGEVSGIDLAAKRVTVRHSIDLHEHTLAYDQVVLGLGSTTSFFHLPGVEEHAMTMKSLTDAIRLRNRIIAALEAAATECHDEIGSLLTVVVAGAGFAGVETIASINDFLRNSLKFYPGLKEKDLRLVLVHPGEVILPELSEKLGRYAQMLLQKRGVEIRGHARVASYDGEVVVLADGTSIQAKTLIWTAGTMPHHLVGALPCGLEKGKVKVTAELAVPDFEGVWALGDCALVPDLTTGKFCPPTAQHALRQGKVLAHNIEAWASGGRFQQFKFKTIGQLATIGHRAGVANIMGFNFSGFIAWWMWRTIYLAKLPRLEKKVRVALDWTLDLFFAKDLCQFMDVREERKKAAPMEMVEQEMAATR